MKPDFHHSLERLRNEQLPPVPPNLTDQVMRRIRDPHGSAAEDRGSFVAHVLQTAFRPQMAPLVLAMAILMGTVTTAVAGHLTPAPRKAVDALRFEVIKNPHYLECSHHSTPSAHHSH